LPLPAHAPELNPVEHLWDELREKFFNNLVFDSINALEDHPESLCAPLSMSPTRSALLSDGLGLLIHLRNRNGIMLGTPKKRQAFLPAARDPGSMFLLAVVAVRQMRRYS
jgi:hypothetical protein